MWFRFLERVSVFYLFLGPKQKTNEFNKTIMCFLRVCYFLFNVNWERTLSPLVKMSGQMQQKLKYKIYLSQPFVYYLERSKNIPLNINKRAIEWSNNNWTSDFQASCCTLSSSIYFHCIRVCVLVLLFLF